jgi:hypothetical protein
LRIFRASCRSCIQPHLFIRHCSHFLKGTTLETVAGSPVLLRELLSQSVGTPAALRWERGWRSEGGSSLSSNCLEISFFLLLLVELVAASAAEVGRAGACFSFFVAFSR